MSRRAVPKANPAVRSAEGFAAFRRAAPKANPAVRSAQGFAAFRRQETVTVCGARMAP
jgi:hypothetical protein